MNPGATEICGDGIDNDCDGTADDPSQCCFDEDGDGFCELLIVHVQDTMTLDGEALKIDAVVVWRIVNGLIAEAWDIPAVFVPPTA